MSRIGETRMDLLRGLEAGVGTTTELAMRTGLPLPATRMTLDNMVRAGDAVKDFKRLPHCKRPVPVYGLASRVGSSPSRPSLDWSLITCWAQWPAGA